MKTPYPAQKTGTRCERQGLLALFFDIVNGFLIDAVAHRVIRLRSVAAMGHFRDDVHLAEIIVRTWHDIGVYADLMLMVWILKREVRAFGGCLGMYRR